jgi:oligopeptidase B
LWLNGYGAYGSCEDPYFSESRFSVLDRGVIFAVAHVRGGGELGTSWYEAGKKLNKMNSFTDFIACMDFLIEHGYTTARQMVIEGGSAGGLLMGTVANMAADKCAVVIADVPFVDAVNTMLDSNLPLTVQEYEEWGNPQDPEIFRYMLSYSPYENVRPQSYPAFLISAGWNDTGWAIGSAQMDSALTNVPTGNPAHRVQIELQ